LKAVYKNRNLVITDASGGNETAVTADGAKRTDQTARPAGTAGWPRPPPCGPGRPEARVPLRRGKVPDYFLQLDQTKLYSKMDIRLPKSGEPNPVVDLSVNVARDQRQARRATASPSRTTCGHYVFFRVVVADGKELLFTRANWRQNILEFTANPDSGVQDDCPGMAHGWIETSPRRSSIRPPLHLGVGADRLAPTYDLSGTNHVCSRGMRRSRPLTSSRLTRTRSCS
jgi:hypothetical protein